MKKLLVTALLATTIFTLAGCGNSSSGGGDAAAAGDTQTAADAGTADSGNTAGSGYVFVSGSSSIPVDAEWEAISEALGEPLNYYEAASCAFGDLDKVWTYNGFTVDTYQLDGVDYVYDVNLTSDAISTPEGVSIGDSADKVKEVYGEPESEDSSQIIYRSGNMKLLFILEGGKVKSIQYCSLVLE